MATLEISFDQGRRVAVLSCADVGDKTWFGLLLRSLRDEGVDVAQNSSASATVPWGQFLSARRIVRDIRTLYNVEVAAEAFAARLLREASARLESFEAARTAPPMPESMVLLRLRAAGFVRTLTREQLRNVGRLAGLPAAATFSVPGAGKTTEALAYYALRANSTDPIFVVAPKNALGAWNEQLLACFGPDVGEFTRLRGGEENIAALLRLPQRFLIITYQQLARDRVPRHVAEFLSLRTAFVFVDESHRIKGRGITSRTVRDIAFLPKGKLIMSGTPMPQAVDDLLAQFEYLYPEVEADTSNVVDKMRAVFVRTTKKELGLPEPQRLCVPIAMLPAQRKLYDLLKREVLRQAEATLTAKDRNAFRALGHSVMRVLQLVSNPALLAASAPIREDLLAAAIDAGDSPKLDYACRRTRQLIAQGKKVLIWSAFRENVETISERLLDLGAVFIHGGIDAGNEENSDTREGRIRRFHDDDKCLVLVANPAAAGEGISLHTVCHHAIYVDRTYNVAHYLQSEDRIHRLGTTVAPCIEIVQCADSIDQSVAQRIEAKTQQMADALDDASLRISPRLVEFDEQSDEDSNEDPTLGMNLDDVRSIVATLGGARA